MVRAIALFNASTSIAPAGGKPPAREITSSRESSANSSRIAEDWTRAVALDGRRRREREGLVTILTICRSLGNGAQHRVRDPGKKAADASSMAPASIAAHVFAVPAAVKRRRSAPTMPDRTIGCATVAASDAHIADTWRLYR